MENNYNNMYRETREKMYLTLKNRVVCKVSHLFQRPGLELSLSINDQHLCMKNHFNSALPEY